METKNYFSTDAAGNILPSATCYVYVAGTTDLATGILNINGAPLSNPFTAQPTGLVQFKAPNGEYDLRVTKSGRDFTIRVQAFDIDDAISKDAAPRLIPYGNEYGQLDSSWLPRGDGDTIDQSILADKKIQDYSAFRSYKGSATFIYVTSPGISGHFAPLSDSSRSDDKGTVIVDGLGRAWGRMYVGALQASWFGLKASNDDNYEAMQAACDCAAALLKNTYNNIAIQCHSGTFKFSRKFICRAAILGVSSQGTPGISLIGNGQENTVLVASASNDSGLIHFTSDKNDEIWRVQGFSLLSDLPMDASANNGYAIIVESTLANGSPGFGDHPRRSVWLDDVYIGGYGTSTGDRARRGNWKKAINVKNKWYPKFSNIRILARYDAASISTRTACEHAILLEGCYSPEWYQVYVHGAWQKGVWSEGALDANEDIEDFRYSDGFIVGPDECFGYQHKYSTNNPNKLYEPGGVIANTHIAFTKNGISIKSHRQIKIDAYLYMPSEAKAKDVGETLPSAILLDSCADVIIKSQFLEPGFYKSNTNATVAVRVIGNSEAILVGGQFGHGGIGLLNDSTAVNRQSIMLCPDLLLTSRRDDSSWPALVPLVDNSKTATRFAPDLSALQDKIVFGNSKSFPASYPVALALESNRIGQVQTAAIEFNAANSAGTKVASSVIRASFAGSDVAGQERTQLSLFARNEGSLREALQLSSHTGNLQSWAVLLVNIDGVISQRRLKVGAPNTGPGSSGRALYIDN